MSKENDDNNSSRKSITPAHEKSRLADEILGIWKKRDHRTKDKDILDVPPENTPRP